MNRVLTLSLVFLLLFAALSFAGDEAQSAGPSDASQPADPYKPVLDRLESLSVLPVPDWRFHADMPHPEDLSLDDSGWETVKTDVKWSSGERVFRRWIEIPEKLNGYTLAGASVRLDLSFDSDGKRKLKLSRKCRKTLFHGNVVYRCSREIP